MELLPGQRFAWTNIASNGMFSLLYMSYAHCLLSYVILQFQPDSNQCHIVFIFDMSTLKTDFESFNKTSRASGARNDPARATQLKAPTRLLVDKGLIFGRDGD